MDMPATLDRPVNIPASWNAMTPGVVATVAGVREWLVPLADFNTGKFNYLIIENHKPCYCFDDAAWTNAVENWRIMAKVAAETGFRGVLFCAGGTDPMANCPGCYENWAKRVDTGHMIYTDTYPAGYTQRPQILATTIKNALPYSEDAIFVFSEIDHVDFFTPNPGAQAWIAAIATAVGR